MGHFRKGRKRKEELVNVTKERRDKTNEGAETEKKKKKKKLNYAFLPHLPQIQQALATTLPPTKIIYDMRRKKTLSGSPLPSYDIMGPSGSCASLTEPMDTVRSAIYLGEALTESIDTVGLRLILVLLNKLRCHARFYFSANNIT